MNSDELYCFDLNGFLLIRNAIPREVVERARPLIDRLETRAELNYHALPGYNNGAEKRIEPAIYEDDLLLDMVMSPRVLACIPRLVKHPRLRSTWVDFKARHGAIGHHSNHTPFNPMDAYYFQDGRVYASVVVACIALENIAEEGGALELIPGSHKSNYPLPTDPAVLAAIRQKIPMAAGDALLFSHDVNHGACNHSTKVRRTLFATFCEGYSSNRQAGNDLHDAIFKRMPEATWRKYLLRSPSPFMDTYPQPAHAPEEESTRLTPVPV